VTKLPSLRPQRTHAPLRRDARPDVQPFLLDRLTHERPQAETGADGMIAPSRVLWRESLLRDLNWLLNSTNLEATEDLAAYPHVRRSVINFGVGALAGARASALDWISIEDTIREAIVQFEPRILAESVEVRCIANSSAQRQRSMLSLEIRGQLCANQAQQVFLLHAEIDLETGHIALRSHGKA